MNNESSLSPLATSLGIGSIALGAPMQRDSIRHLRQLFKDYRSPVVAHDVTDFNINEAIDNFSRNLQFGDIILRHMSPFDDGTLSEYDYNVKKLERILGAHPTRHSASLVATFPSPAASQVRGLEPAEAIIEAARQNDPKRLRHIMAGAYHTDPHFPVTKPTPLYRTMDMIRSGEFKKLVKDKGILGAIDSVVRKARMPQPTVQGADPLKFLTRVSMLHPRILNPGSPNYDVMGPAGNDYIEILRPKKPLTESERIRLFKNLLSNNTSMIDAAANKAGALTRFLGRSTPVSGPIYTCAGGVCVAYKGIRDIPGGTSATPADLAASKDFDVVKAYRWSSEGAPGLEKSKYKLNDLSKKMFGNKKAILKNYFKAILPKLGIGSLFTGAGLLSLGYGLSDKRTKEQKLVENFIERLKNLKLPNTPGFKLPTKN